MTNSSINKYEIFLKVADLGNITRASKALNYTQSGVSHAIAALEKETGFPLFVRNSNGVTLTKNGQFVLEPIRSLVNQQRNLAQTIFSLNNTIAGTLKIGTFTSVSAQWLPEIIKRFNDIYTNVKLELFAGSYEDIYSWILSGEIDCGFLTSPVSGRVTFTPLSEDEMKILMSSNHPLAKKNAVTIDEISKESLILPAKGCDKDIQNVLKKTQQTIDIKYTLSDDISVMAMVEKGFGIGILPSLMLRNFSFDIVTKPFAPAEYRTIGLASLPNSQVSIVTKTFIEFLLANKELLAV